MGGASGVQQHGEALAYLNTVTFHADEEARRQLGPGSASIEESRRGMSEPALAQQVVCLNGAVNVCLVDPHRHPHQHVLRALNHLPIDSQQI